jgi:type II secretory ATPase GspE/PulE/Tfp pilus assembly ATPase PilB-like protein
MARVLPEILKLVVESGILKPETAEVLNILAHERNEPLWETLLRENKVTEAWLADMFARRLRIPLLVTFSPADVNEEAAHRIPESLARKYLCIPFASEGRTLKVVFVDPSDLEAIKALEFYTACRVEPAVAPRSHILETLDQVFSRSEAIDIIDRASESHGVQILSSEGAHEINLDQGELLEVSEIPPIVKLVNLVLTEALRANASDIHIEPAEEEIRIRLRVDGVLRDFLQAPVWLHSGLVTRLKVLSKLDITEKRVPQDGRFAVRFQGTAADLRVSTLPTQFGEKAVLRLLGSSDGLPTPSELGVPASQLEAMKDAVTQPQGMIIVTGPTGSGKTTTLYSLLNHRRSSEVSIVTVEDPIEYHLEGANQVQINAKVGLNFANCLRSILRQDPDVILLGEIRDRETAEIAFHAAMTGHLVLTSLHTNSSVATVLRLLDLGVDPFVICSTVMLVVAQRLARTICDACREPYVPSPRLLRRLRWEDSEFAFTHGRGCKACHGSGFKGRTGIYEMLRMTPSVREAISGRASEADILKAAHGSGFATLIEDAHEKIRSGTTTPEEIVRVIQLLQEGERHCPDCGRLIPSQRAECVYCVRTAPPPESKPQPPMADGRPLGWSQAAKLWRKKQGPNLVH